MSSDYKIAVTGASGFIGAYLVSDLSKRGIEASVLTRRSVDTQALPHLNYHPGDLLQPGSLRQVVKGADVVLHLAGYAHASGRPNYSEITRHHKINLEGTQNLFRCAAEAGVRRFVFVSSVKAGGEHIHECLDESSALMLRDHYGSIKRETEDWLFEEGRHRDLEISVLRPALVYGAGVKGNLAAMLRALDRGWFPPMPETHNIRSMVCVHDVVTALLSAATRPEATGQVCILTDGEEYSTRRIYNEMSVALSRPIRNWSLPVPLLRSIGLLGDLAEVLMRRQFPVNSRSIVRLLNSACYKSIRAEEVLQFRPQYKLTDILPSMVAAYRHSTLAR